MFVVSYDPANGNIAVKTCDKQWRWFADSDVTDIHCAMGRNVGKLEMRQRLGEERRVFIFRTVLFL